MPSQHFPHELQFYFNGLGNLFSNLFQHVRKERLDQIARPIVVTYVLKIPDVLLPMKAVMQSVNLDLLENIVIQVV